jgi:hypothetical protein
MENPMKKNLASVFIATLLSLAPAASASPPQSNPLESVVCDLRLVLRDIGEEKTIAYLSETQGKVGEPRKMGAPISKGGPGAQIQLDKDAGNYSLSITLWAGDLYATTGYKIPDITRLPADERVGAAYLSLTPGVRKWLDSRKPGYGKAGELVVNCRPPVM